MAVNIEIFEKRWDTISRETLSSVRKQLKYHTFDNTSVDKTFKSACSEWFVGTLAPHVWFENLKDENPEISARMMEYINHIQLIHKEVSKPSKTIGYIVTILSLPMCYLGLEWLTDMGWLSKTLTTIGTAVLVGYASMAWIKGKESSYEEEIVDSYRDQLNEHRKVLKELLSTAAS